MNTHYRIWYFHAGLKIITKGTIWPFEGIDQHILDNLENNDSNHQLCYIETWDHRPLPHELEMYE